MPSFNSNLSRLFEIAQKTERLIIGLMSGTSLDGLDIALCSFTGSGFATRFELLEFMTLPYPETLKEDIRQVFARREIDLEKLCLLNAQLGHLHAGMVLQAIQQWNYLPGNIDLIASHGQTIYHAPQRLHHQEGYPNATLQIGDADHIAFQTGIITYSDFRQKHVAAGGEGAPLALYGDVLLGSSDLYNRVLLNIGGIANLTYLPAAGYENVICTDVGPGNTLIDSVCRQYFSLPYDAGGKIAFTGQVHEGLLSALLNNAFFTQLPPKTTGPELFDAIYLQQAIQQANAKNISAADLVTTLSMLTAKSIALFIHNYIPATVQQLLLSGGGAQNTFIVQALSQLLPTTIVDTTQAIGLNPDAKEAILFALLANEALVGEPIAVGNNPAVLMGKLSFPV